MHYVISVSLKLFTEHILIYDAEMHQTDKLPNACSVALASEKVLVEKSGSL